MPSKIKTPMYYYCMLIKKDRENPQTTTNLKILLSFFFSHF
jgi:hypothetical protein